MHEPQRASAVSRWARACVLTGLVVAVSSLAHASAGGQLPPPLSMAGPTVVTLVVSAMLLGRPASRCRVVALLAGGQASLHMLMTVLSGHLEAQMASAAAHGHTHQLLHHHRAAAATGGPPDWLGHVQEDLSGPNLVMALAHLAAGVVLGWWVASGERALWALLLLLAAGVGVLLARAVLGLRLLSRLAGHRARQQARQRPDHVSAASLALLSDAVVRRGPPELSRA